MSGQDEPFGSRVYFVEHAVLQMIERDILKEDVEAIIETGEIIDEYIYENSFPRELLLGWIDQRPLHVVVEHNMPENLTTVVTAYEPDPEIWRQDFRRRR